MNEKLLRALHVFVRTVETGSMSSAAAELAMTTSAISQQIKQIEQDVGLSLFNRSPRVLTLTEAGTLYYQSCLKMLAVATESSEQLQYLQNHPCGQLKLVAPVGFGGGLLSEPLKQLTMQFSDINVQLTLSDEPVDMIKAGADLALAIGPLEDSNLIARQLAYWPLVLCVHKSHPLAEHANPALDTLNEHTRIAHISAEHPLKHRQTQQSSMLPKPRIVVNNMQSIIQLVCDGVGYAILPEPEVRSLLNNKELIELCTDWQLPYYSVFAVTPARDTLAAKTRAAINTLKNSFASISAH
ncbi:LysR family transcriptional regulator [Pseudoalteromonas mariniglutinosa]|uniref:LysR family transcriptional regulator n=1 Tax=Pseudoalteromonas mariniglutinosa TaxID=206042 RepID=UPI003850C026